MLIDIYSTHSVEIPSREREREKSIELTLHLLVVTLHEFQVEGLEKASSDETSLSLLTFTPRDFSKARVSTRLEISAVHLLVLNREGNIDLRLSTFLLTVCSTELVVPAE